MGVRTMSVAAFTFDETEAPIAALAVGTYASLLAAVESDADREKKKRHNVDEKMRVLATVGVPVAPGVEASQLCSLLSERLSSWTEVKRTALLIDVAFAAPFAPYELNVSKEDQRAQLRALCPALGLAPERADQVLDSIAAARRAHRQIAWGKIAMSAVLGGVVVAAGGYAAAPLIAAHLGVAAGLSGAAAVSHGLALLGGGSLAAGGAGIAGGMTLLSVGGGAVGGLAFGGASALWSAGYAAALSELVKLQVSYKEVLLRTQLRCLQASDVIEELLRQRDELKVKLDEERDRNDVGAARVKDLERIDQGYADAIAWMKEQQTPRPGLPAKGRLQSVIEMARAVTSRGPARLADDEKRREQRVVGSFRREVGLDELDVLAAGVAGAIGGAIDLLVVAIPSDVTYLGQYEQAGSVITRALKAWTVPSDNGVASCAKVPFDQVSGANRVRGMFPGNHRFLTPGHDPLLGWVVGVFDILRGGRTSIGVDGMLRFHDGVSAPTNDVAAAVASELLHLISDVATKAGLPAPLMTAAGLLRFGSFGEGQRTVADLARYMYLNGYDLRHFLTTCSTPAAIRLVLSAYSLGRQFADDEYRDDCAAAARRDGGTLEHPRLETIRLLADAVACAANAGKVALFQGNPSAFNYGQWLTLIRSASVFAANRFESATEVLQDRAAANLKKLAALLGPDLADPTRAF